MSPNYRHFIFLLIACLAAYLSKSQCNPTINPIPGTCNTLSGFQISFPTCTVGTAPYSMIWVPPGGSCPTPTFVNYPGPGTFTNYFSNCNCAGLYQLIVFDALANVVGVSSALSPTCSSSPTFVPIGIPILPSCNGDCDGTRSVLWQQGSGVLTVTFYPVLQPSYTFTTTNGSTTTFTGLCEGTHTLDVSDNVGCLSTGLTFTMGQPPPLAGNTVVTHPNCNGSNNGSFSVSPVGGTPNYTVVFSTGATVAVVPFGTAFVSGLTPGVISATVTDSRGCSVTVSGNIVDPPVIVISPTQTNVTCGGTCNGSASVAVSGGSGTYTYSWNPGPGNSAGISGICAGGHIVTVTDNNNCIRTQTFNITQPASVTINPTLTNITCNGTCTGSGTVSATGPAPPISFTWVATGPSTISTTTVISSQCAGIYTIYASAIADPTCIVNKTVSITQPPTFTLSATSVSVSCINSCTGIATANPGGGNGAPYSYTWTSPSGPVQTTQTATNLCAGIHTLSVKDASNCSTATLTVNVAQPAPFTSGISTSSINCNGVCNGVINASPSGGTSPYTYTLISTTSTVTSASPAFTGLCAGNYTLIIKDAVSPCGQSFTVNVLQPNPLLPSISTTSITCFNLCNGALGANASGGTPAYTYTWNTPTGTASGGALTNRCFGNYTLTVTDQYGCSNSATTTLAQPPDLSINIGISNANCFSFCNGALSASINGGTPGYTLVWSNGFTGNPNSGLCPGNYTLTVTDMNTCVKTATALVISPGDIVLTQSVTPALCAGTCNGSATITASGGTGPFSFQFNTVPVTTNSTGIISGLCTGNYLVNVTDANACSKSIAFSITSPPLLSAAITGTQNSCTSCTGAATVTASNGTPGYSYVWTNSLSTVVSTLSAAGSLCPGSYSVTVTDNNSCITTRTVNIQQTIVVAAVSGGTGIQCFGMCTGSAVVSPSGGSAPYTYTWTPTAQNTQTATNMCAGSYTVLVKEGSPSGCTNTATINITAPPPMTVAVSQTNLNCFNVCNGSMSSTVSGGSGIKTYSWSPGGQSSSNISSQCAGGYTLRISDANGCTVSPQTFTLTQPTMVTATFTPVSPSSCSLNNGSICSQAGGGSGSGYTYSWSPVAGTGSCISAIPAGTYSLILTDGTGCSSTLSTILNNPVGPTITVSQQSVTCFGANTGSAVVNITGVPAFSYSWTPAVSTASSASSSSATGLSAGMYVVKVTDNNGCVTNQTINISQAPQLTVSSNVSNPKCYSSADGSIGIVPGGGTPTYSYAWSGGTLIASSQNVSGLSAGNYSLVVTDNNNCSSPFTFTLNNPQALTLTAVPVNSVICGTACDGTIAANASGGTAPLTYSWFPIGAFSGSSTATVLNLCPNLYTVSVTDVNNCFVMQTIQLAASTFSSAILVQNASCSNSCNATATHSVSGGMPGYTFSWSSSPASTPSIGALCVGNYTGYVSDANGCISEVGFTVTPLSTFSIASIVNQPKCNATCNGSISITPINAQGSVTYSWSPLGSGQNPGNLCAGSYTLLATDNNSCQALSVITLTNPPSILANVTYTNPACSSTICSGFAVSNPANTTGVVQFTWLPSGPNSASLINICAGDYTLHIEDSNNCTNTQTFTLINPPTLNINTSTGPASCGVSNGSISVIVSGGNPGYTYSWNPSVSSSSAASGLGAAIYTIIVSDQSSCTNSLTVPLSNSNGPSAPITFTANVCHGDCAGTASLGLISGGTAPYNYSWISPSTTLNPIMSLCAGSYTAQITDANSCITYTAATITQPSQISILPNISMPTCNGICNGSINVTVSGGTAPYNYSWTPAAPNSSVINNICGGVYSLTIGYNGVCSSTTEVINVPVQLNLSFSETVAPNVCYGDCNGNATVNIVQTQGIPSPFTFNWSSGQMSSGMFSSSVGGLCNGVYSVIATGTNGCKSSYSVSINSPSQLSISSEVVSPICNQCNGTSTISASGGLGSGYTYTWSNGSTNAIVSGLCAGLYQVKVSDGTCSRTESLVINNAGGIGGASFAKEDERCAGLCNGAATVTAIGGNAPIVYNWINPSLINSNNINNLCGGIYFVQMTDAKGCIRTESVNISAAVSISLQPFVTNPNCGGPPFNGSAGITVSGGTPAYSFSWSPVASTASILSGIGPGNYTITVTDNSSGGGCSTSSVISLSSLNGPVLSFTQSNNPCFGDSVAVVNVDVISPGSALPIYNWSNGSSSPSSGNLGQGIITLTVTDANNGCKTAASYTIIENPQLLVNSNVKHVLCNQNCDGQINVLPIGGVLAYTFSWSPVSGSNSLRDSLCPGDYTIKVTDSEGCIATKTIPVLQGSSISVTPTLGNASCISKADGTLSIAGSADYTYLWSAANGFTSSLQNLLNVPAGIYSLSIIDSSLCRKDTSFTVVPTLTVIARAGRDTIVCPQSSVLITEAGSEGAVSYSWFLLPNTTVSVANTTSFVLNNAVQNYSYQLVATSSISGCYDTDTIHVKTFEVPYLDPGPSFTVPVFSTVTLGGNPTSLSLETITWTPSLYLDNPFAQNPMASNTINITYTVSIRYGEGCIVSDTVSVFLYPEIKINNGFTPNNDGKNDLWVIDYIDQFPDNSVEIYNRWGELLFQQKPYQNNFDGKYNGKNLPVGTYYYVIKLNHPAYLKPYTGPLTIFR